MIINKKWNSKLIPRKIGSISIIHKRIDSWQQRKLNRLLTGWNLIKIKNELRQGLWQQGGCCRQSHRKYSHKLNKIRFKLTIKSIIKKHLRLWMIPRSMTWSRISLILELMLGQVRPSSILKGLINPRLMTISLNFDYIFKYYLEH